MFSGFIQAVIVTAIVIFSQTTKHIHCHDAPTEVVDESHLLSLTADTFDDAVKSNRYLLVKFVAPWCGHCKTLAPVYAAAAKQLAESGSEIKLATVDATVEKDLARIHGVRGYPTIKFFNNGTAIEYNGGRAQNEIIAWLEKKTGPPAKEINTVDELNELKESDDVVVIGAFKDMLSEDANGFLKVAETMDGLPFGITSNSDVFKELGITQDTVVLLKKFDEGRNDLTSSFDEISIRDFIFANELPVVIDFSSDTAEKIFGGKHKIHVLLFNSKNSDTYDKIINEFDIVAKEFRGKLLFVYVDADEKENGRVYDYFGIKTTNIPDIRLVSFLGDMTKYKPELTGIDSKVLSQFIQDFYDNKLKPHLLSQDVPEDWDKAPVKVLVGKNFDEVAFDQNKTVLVAFVAPWCGHCKKLTPIYEELGEKYKDNDDVIIAKLDSTANELENIKIGSFPTIKLFPKGSDKAVDYSGERTVEALVQFIDSHSAEGGLDAPDESEQYAEGEPVEMDDEDAQAEAEAEADEEEPAHVDL